MTVRPELLGLRYLNLYRYCWHDYQRLTFLIREEELDFFTHYSDYAYQWRVKFEFLMEHGQRGIDLYNLLGKFSSWGTMYADFPRMPPELRAQLEPPPNYGVLKDVIRIDPETHLVTFCESFKKRKPIPPKKQDFRKKSLQSD